MKLMVPVDASVWGAEDLGFLVVITRLLALVVRLAAPVDRPAMYTFWPFKKTTDSYAFGDDGLIDPRHRSKGLLRNPGFGV